jgi:hypothetical protein
MDTTFAHSYECEKLTELPPPASPHFYYPGASTRGGHDGIIAKIRAEDGKEWLGTFAFGKMAPKAPSGIFATPDAGRLCVVAKGAGYLVSACSPMTWEAVQATPILDVRPIRAQGIIVFATFTDLVAYGSTGIKWRTRQLSWDNLKITAVTDTFIEGEFEDFHTEATAVFTVDLATGAHHGGIDRP